MSDTFSPFPWFILPPFANAEYNRTSACFQRVAHGTVSSFRLLSFIGAPVVFQVIDSPCGVCTCILKLISAASGSSLACFGACTRIYSHFQSFGMHIICQCFHSIGKTFGIDLYISFFVSSYLPAVVDDQVFIACILHACGNHGVRHFFDELFAHIASEFVPAVPSHRRSLCQCVKYRVGYFFFSAEIHLCSGCKCACQQQDYKFCFHGTQGSFHIVFIFCGGKSSF